MKLTTRGVIGAAVLGVAGLVILLQVLCALQFGQFMILGICVGGVMAVWFRTRHIQSVRLKIFTRAFAFAIFLWPFIPHPGVEWSSPFPPAGYWLLIGLVSGDLPVFELISIVLATLVMGSAGRAVHQDRHRHAGGAP